MMLQPLARKSYSRQSETSMVAGKEKEYLLRPQPHSGRRSFP